MTVLEELFASVRRSPYRFVFHADEAGRGADVTERFATHGVAIETEELPPGGPAPFFVIEEDGVFRGALGLTEVEDILEPPIHRVERIEDVSTGYRVLFDVLDDAVFSATSRRELLAVSREIEERAFRIGIGTLRVGFQKLSAFESQEDVYRKLATETNLDVHVYGAADWTPPTIPGVSYHEYPELDRYWLLAYDSETPQAETCALVARQTGDMYDSFWTNDPETTRTVLDELEAD